MKHKILYRTPHSCVTEDEYIQATMKGLVMFVDTDDVLRFKMPTKFNKDWFPDEGKSLRMPGKGDVVKRNDEIGWILYHDEDEYVVRWKSDEVEGISDDMFFNYTSRGRQTIWEI